MYNAFQVIGLREQVNQMHLFDPITTGEQWDQVARQGDRIAGDISNAWRAQGRQQSRHAFSQATSGRVHHRQVGPNGVMKKDRALTDSPRIFRAGQILFCTGLDYFSIRGLIVDKIG